MSDSSNKEKRFEKLKEMQEIVNPTNTVYDILPEDKTPMDLTHNEFFEISRALEMHHAIFYMFWELGKPYFTKKIDTAAVAFNREGEHIDFLFNPQFWDILTPYERLFIIGHECLHVILNHGIRIRGLKNQVEAMLANQALDIIVNHSLEDDFKFTRTRIDAWEDYCWIETLFDNPKAVPRDETYEYYYNRLKKELEEKLQEQGYQDIDDFVNKNGCPEPGKVTMDDHTGLCGDPNDFEQIDQEELEKRIVDNALDRVKDDFSAREKQDLLDKIKDKTEGEKADGKKIGGTLAGSLQGAIALQLKIGSVKKKKKWETVIKKWEKKNSKTQFTEEDQWADKARRLAFFGNEEMMIPSSKEKEFWEKNRTEVWFFADTSGSCASYAKRFFTAAMTLSPKRFDIKLFCFDTKVYPTSLKSQKLYGFGGTSFSPIEDYIKANTLKVGRPYPAAVFLITDGYGNNVSPLKPKNWYWFLTEHSSKHCIPNDSNIFELKDYE